MKKHCRNLLWSLSFVWLVALFCDVALAAEPDWEVPTYPYYTGVMARVKINGTVLRSNGSKLAAFHGGELRGVADIRSGTGEDYADGESYFNLMFGSESADEKGFTFKLWNSADDTIYDLDKILDFDVNYPTKPDIYGGFTQNGTFVPCIMNEGTVNPQPVKYSISIVNGTSDKTEAAPGEIVTITATLPTGKGLKRWTASDGVEFIGSVLGTTTTFRMPASNATVTASFVNKSDMQAVAVRSTTNAGDDTATEPSSSTASATDKGKFTFTRTSSSGALTVYYSIRGTATNGTDYKQITSSVTFANGSTSVTREIEPLYDGVQEGDETVTVVLVPQASTQTFRGGTVTDATVIIIDVDEPDGNVIVNLTYTLYPAAAVAAGAKWKIDNGDWLDSGEMVTTSIGTHTISFKDVAGYTTPEPQTYDMPVVPVGIPTVGGSATYEEVTSGPVEHTLTVSGGKINLNGVMVSSAQFTPGDIVTITANPPSTNQGLKIWTSSKDVEFVGSKLGATTTIRMPAYDVTVTASFVNKSDMQAVAVRSTTNTGDDTATEPSSSTASATDKGKFTFTRTSSSGALTVYYSIRGTATNGTDYKQITSSVTFTNGSTSVTREIEPLYDGVQEGDETVTVVLVPQASTQTYRGGAVTDATVTIKDSQPVSNPTVKYTLSPAAAVTAGAQWKIDTNGAWNASGATVTSTVGAHTIYFKDVTGYTTPASQSVTLTAGQAKTGTATYVQSSGKYTLTVKNGTINGGTSSTAQFTAGTEVTIAATLPANQGLKIWTPSKDVEFVGSKLGATTTIRMPAYDVTVTASFVNKSDMQAVAVRSTTNTGDDTAKEPSSSTGSATDKGKFTFTRTSSSGALTVYYSVRGTAVNGTDYKQIASSVTFANGVTSVTREIEPLYDELQEGDETVTVVLIPPSSTQTYRGGAVTDATVTIHDTAPAPQQPYHPADADKDNIISGTELLEYAGPVKSAALTGREYEWDGVDVLSFSLKATRGGDEPKTRGDDVAITRTVSPAVYSAGSTVNVTLTISGADKMASLFIGEKIPSGWTVLGNAAADVVDGVLRMTWEKPEIPSTFTYSIKAPTSNLAESYVISSNPQDTACFTDELKLISVVDTALINNANSYHYHPADCVNKDRRISGVEYLAYAGPVKAAALGNYEYEWDGVDVMSIHKKGATRGGAAADDVAIVRYVDTTSYEAGGRVTVTLSVIGADGMVSLFVGEKIPEGWTVLGNDADNVGNGVLRMTWDAPNIPETVTYTIQAPAKDLSPICRIESSAVDTGCFTDSVQLLKVEDAILTWNTDRKPAEWPQDMKLYTPAAGRNFRESGRLSVTFSWPAILEADGYRLIVATCDGAVVFDETVDGNVCAVGGLAAGSFVWNVTAIGDGCMAGTVWQDFAFSVVPDTPAPIIAGAVADGTAIRLAFDKTDAGYADGVFAYQIGFFSLKTSSWISQTQDIEITNGQAVIDLGVETANGYLYISPATTSESEFVELYIK